MPIPRTAAQKTADSVMDWRWWHDERAKKAKAPERDVCPHCQERPTTTDEYGNHITCCDECRGFRPQPKENWFCAFCGTDRQPTGVQSSATYPVTVHRCNRCINRKASSSDTAFGQGRLL